MQWRFHFLSSGWQQRRRGAWLGAFLLIALATMTHGVPLLLAAAPTAPVSLNELDFWVRAGRENADILSEVRQRGLFAEVDDYAQRRLRGDGADAALLAALANVPVVSADAAARARQDLAVQADKERRSRELVLQQARVATELQRQPGQRQAVAPTPTPAATASASADIPTINEPPGGADVNGWKVGFMNACKQAAAEKKMVFVDFTGSDWCGWCQKLEREVFLTPQFKAYAEKKLVLVRADFPHRHPQSAEVKAQNAKLQAAFGISGYPTIVVLNSAGQPVGRLGYLEGGPVPFLAALQKLESR